MVPVQSDHDLIAGFDRPALLGVRAHETFLHVSESVNGTAFVEHPAELLPCLLRDLVGLGLDHLRAVEDVAVLQKVGFVGQDLLGAQAPLLVPGTRETERLVPRR